MSPTLFTSKKDWLNHMKNGHKLKSWTCLDHETKLSFPTSPEFFQHMYDQHYGEFEEEDLDDLADACFQSITTDLAFETCPFCPESDQKDSLMTGGGIQHLSSHLMSFSRISLDGYTEEQISSSDVSSSTHRTRVSAERILSETITDGLQPGFFEYADQNPIDVELMESQQIPPDPGEENWELFSEAQKESQPDVNDDPILKNLSQNSPRNEQLKRSTSTPSFKNEHQIKLDQMNLSEAGYIAYLDHIVQSYRADTSLKDNTETYNLQVQLSRLITQHNILVSQLHHLKDEQQESYINTLGDWLDQAKFHFMEYFEAAAEVIRQDYALNLKKVETEGSPVVGIDIETHLESPRWILERYRHFLSSVHDRKRYTYTKRRSAASVIQQIHKLLNYAVFFLGSGNSDAPLELPFDRFHVADKYPNTEEAIVDRFGLAITRRRSVIRYRQRQRDAHDEDPNQFTGDDEEAEVVNGDQDAESNPSSLSGISWTTGNGGGAYYSLPSFTVGAPFECKICFSVISISSRRAWARHVFGDLMPYLCFYPDCPTPNRLYGSGWEWFDHLRSQHSVSNDPDAIIDCPLCQGSVSSGKQFRRHLGRHMEQLALFALPTSEMANEEEPDQEDMTDDQEDMTDDQELEDTSDEEDHKGHDTPINLYALVG